MTKQIGKVMLRALLIVTLVFGVAPVAQAQMPAAKAKAALAKSPPAPAAKRAGGAREGIKVHGHWTIEIRNPDGTLASRSEFENSLQGGETLLAGLLGNTITPPITWVVALFAAQNSANYCNLWCDVGPVTATVVSDTVELTATNTAVTDTTIIRVGTRWNAPSLPGIRWFSSHDLTPAEQKTVVKDQIIQVKVVFSFS
jgi:hypothetical protein